MEKGKLIVIEGACDGVGKTTQSQLLKSRLESDERQVITHHFPSYGTYHGILAEKYLQGEYGNASSLSPYFINSLYAMDRAIAWNTLLKPNYDNGSVILLDRYTTSSLIYQSALFKTIKEKKGFIDYVIDFEYNKLGIKSPDKTIFLTMPFEVSEKLRKSRFQESQTTDIHERDLEYMKRVYDNAMFVADYLYWDHVNCAIEEDMRPKEDIHEEVYKLVYKK